MKDLEKLAFESTIDIDSNFDASLYTTTIGKLYNTIVIEYNKYINTYKSVYASIRQLITDGSMEGLIDAFDIKKNFPKINEGLTFLTKKEHLNVNPMFSENAVEYLHKKCLLELKYEYDNLIKLFEPLKRLNVVCDIKIEYESARMFASRSKMPFVVFYLKYKYVHSKN